MAPPSLLQAHLTLHQLRHIQRRASFFLDFPFLIQLTIRLALEVVEELVPLAQGLRILMHWSPLLLNMLSFHPFVPKVNRGLCLMLLFQFIFSLHPLPSSQTLLFLFEVFRYFKLIQQVINHFRYFLS